MTEIASQDSSLTVVERSMGDRRIAQGAARSAVLKRRYDAPIKDVWSAITAAERVGQELGPAPTHSPQLIP